MQTLTPQQERAAIEEQVTLLFSGNSMPLHRMESVAGAMTGLPGIASFLTRVPWQLQLTNGRVISGYSENLARALQDIAAQARRLMLRYGADAVAALSIDELRLDNVSA